MDRNNNNRDSENTNSVENHADVRGNGNKTNQAGGNIIEGDYTKFPDEDRVKTDIFTTLSAISHSIGRLLFKLGVGDRLERLSLPSAGILGVFLLTLLGSEIYAVSEFTGIVGTLMAIVAYLYSQVTVPLLEIAANRPEIGLILLLILGLPIWYKGQKFTSTCERCEQPFAVMMRTIEYPSRASFDKEGNRHVPLDREAFCIYCDGDAEVTDETQSDDDGESVPQIMADGGGDDDAGACVCSCRNRE